MLYLTCNSAVRGPDGAPSACVDDATVIEVATDGEFRVYCDDHAHDAGGPGYTVIHSINPLHSTSAGPRTN